MFIYFTVMMPVLQPLDPVVPDHVFKDFRRKQSYVCGSKRGGIEYICRFVGQIGEGRR